MKAMEVYYDINIDILNNFNYKNRNYETLQNVNEISIDNPIFGLIKEINQNRNFNSKINNIIDLFNKITFDKDELENLALNQENINSNIKIPMTIPQTENILNQMKKCVCKINGGIGIFAKVKYENEINTILITNEDIINEKEINCELYNNNKKRIIIDNERNKYNDNNIQIVEIKPDIDKINDYIEIDDNIS